jgi:hypothetical protein
MEGAYEDMEVDVITQHDDESTRMGSSWRIEVNLTLKKYQVKSLFLFKKLMFL